MIDSASLHSPDLFRGFREAVASRDRGGRQRSSAMRSGIAVVALPCLGEKYLPRTRCIQFHAFSSSQNPLRRKDESVFRPGDHE
jgi:hypothetical protein